MWQAEPFLWSVQNACRKRHKYICSNYKVTFNRVRSAISTGQKPVADIKIQMACKIAIGSNGNLMPFSVFKILLPHTI